VGRETGTGLNCGESALHCPRTHPARAAAENLDIVVNKRYSLTAMGKMVIDYEALDNLDTEALLEFEAELKRKIAREARDDGESDNKKGRGKRRYG